MNKRKVFNTYNEISTRQGRGEYWFSQAVQYVNPQTVFIYVASLKVFFPTVQYWVLVTGVVIFKIFTMIAKYFIGLFDEKFGLWKAQSEYIAKKEHLAPFNKELQETLEEICKKLKIKNHFKKL